MTKWHSYVITGELYMTLHPLNTTHDLQDAYYRYLQTIKPFQSDWLRDEFDRAIHAKNMLVKGPLIEISPPFVTDSSIGDLVQEGVLSRRFQRLCTEDHLPYQRKLYKHQVAAIRKVVAGRNLVVATGTGSGKTETFLIPILNHLLREEEQGTLGQPGVRALLLYPMNALANDQLKRLRGLLAYYPAITFGRYTGETKDTLKEAREIFLKNNDTQEPIPNELICRPQMQAAPPHILLTNYAMLEYLLLRPADSAFFDGDTSGHWRFLVLDEAHTYDGANATEMAMLLRRLQDRVIQNPQEHLQCIATSATLGGKDDFPKVVEFASNLFNQPFEWDQSDQNRQNVIASERKTTAELGQPWGAGSPALYHELRDIVDQVSPAAALNRVAAACRNHSVPEPVVTKALAQARGFPADGLQRALYAVLRGDRNIHHVQDHLSTGPQDLEQIAPDVFPDAADPAQAMIDLVALAVMARARAEDMPLLPARYHVFARALEGAFVCLNREAHERQGELPFPSLFLRRYKLCPHCGSRVFELANCTRCGMAYLVGNETPGDRLPYEENTPFKIKGGLDYLTQNSILYDAIQVSGTGYFALTEDGMTPLDEDEAVASDADIDVMLKDAEVIAYQLCPICGALHPANEPRHCDCEVKLIRLNKVDIGRKTTLQRCVSCSTRSPGGAIYRFITGQDAPVSVLASALYQELPPSKDKQSAMLPGNGRKLLNFTDSRQNAAFFAPYVERAQRRNLRRRLIMKTLQEDATAQQRQLRLDDLLPRLLNKTIDAGVFQETDSYDKKERTVAVWLMQEFSPLDRRISLEGLGLIQFRPVQPKGWAVPDFLKESPWNFNSGQASDVITLLLNTLRRQGAITYLLSQRVDLLQEGAFAPRQKAFYFRQEGSNPKQGIFGWLPQEGYSNARLDLLERLLVRRGFEQKQARLAAQDMLRSLWDYLSQPRGPWATHFKVDSMPQAGTVHRIEHNMWDIVPTPDGDLRGWYICDRCQNISAISIDGICPTYGCAGTLGPLSSQTPVLSNNLYREAYLHGDPVPLRAEEHTAQWTSDAAAEVQNQFIHGEVNLLSCSTTFELGVDVGDLEAVVMRNMPPTTANYVQRAGRAGRRTDSAAFVLTFAQRRSHDLNFYSRPEAMVAGKVKPPVAVLINEKIVRRHLHSVVFAAFFRWALDKHGRTFKNVGEFFVGANGTDSGPQLLEKFLAERPEMVKQALMRVLPKELHNEFGIADWTWVEHLTTPQGSGVLDVAALEVSSEIGEFAQLEQQAADDRKYSVANRYKDVQNQIARRDLLGFLGSRGVLPKYGFPTDVVELKTNHLQAIAEAKRVELQRDLRMAISEFAPGGEVVAAKVIWRSQGIRKLPNREWEPFKYVVCGACRKFYHGVADLPLVCTCGHVLQDKPEMKGTFIIPEQGFIAASDVRAPGEESPQRIYASRVYFADYRLPKTEEREDQPFELDGAVSRASIQVYKRYSRFGWLAVVNDGYGQGFRICRYCGYAEPVELKVQGKKKAPSAHHNPLTGKDCRGPLDPFHLGHRFMTDVLEIKTLGLAFSMANTYSLLYALLEGASEALGIRRDDIEGTIYPQGSGQPPSLILYDNVPGGAGHVKRVFDNLRPSFQAALARVASCECGEETSCYNCLRNYRNQYFHDILQRGLAVNVLRQMMGVDV